MNFVILVFVLAALAQQGPHSPDLDRRIERQVRAYSQAPADAHILIGGRSPSIFTGYENLPVTIEANGVKKTLNFLIAKDGSRLLYLTEIDLKEDPYVRNIRRIDVNGRPWRGAEHGKVSIIVYDDFQCPFCARMYVTLMNEVMVHYRDSVKIIMKDFPILDAHSWAMRAAIDAHCLAAQDARAYWDFSDYAHTHQAEVSARVKSDPTQMDVLAREVAKRHNLNSQPLEACLTRQDPSLVESSLAEGKSLGIGATPTVFVNGQEAEGVLTPEQLRAMVDRALSEAPAPNPGP
jgi:protein-disulfide isomerase